MRAISGGDDPGVEIKSLAWRDEAPIASRPAVSFTPQELRELVDKQLDELGISGLIALPGLSWVIAGLLIVTLVLTRFQFPILILWVALCVTYSTWLYRDAMEYRKLVFSGIDQARLLELVLAGEVSLKSIYTHVARPWRDIYFQRLPNKPEQWLKVAIANLDWYAGNQQRLFRWVWPAHIAFIAIAVVTFFLTTDNLYQSGYYFYSLSIGKLEIDSSYIAGFFYLALIRYIAALLNVHAKHRRSAGLEMLSHALRQREAAGETQT